MAYSLFVIACALLIIVYYDSETRLRSIFARKTLQKRLAYITWNSPRLFFALTGNFLGFKFIFENTAKRPIPKQFLIISNHQSLLDIPVFFFFFSKYHVRFVSKKELGRWIPLISQVLRYQEHCLVDRHANQIQSMKRLDAFARRSAKMGWSPLIFPEGTRSRDGYVLPFHSAGVRRMLDLAPMPVVTVAIDGGWKISDFASLAHIRGAQYRVRILNVYDAPQNKKESAALLETAREEISKQINEWNGRA
ncbi:MAG: lysophospholipid acyltransferase family protein [Treponemataceae bacterium]